MIKLSISVKRKDLGKLEEGRGKIEGITLSLHKSEARQGIVRLRSLQNDKERRKNGQLVITEDGLGVIREPMAKRDEKGQFILPNGVSVAVRNLAHKARVYNLKQVNVVNIIDNRSGDTYHAAESDYSRLLVDDTLVEFVVTRRKKALLTERSRKELEKYTIFAKKRNGVRVLNELIKKNIGSI